MQVRVADGELEALDGANADAEPHVPRAVADRLADGSQRVDLAVRQDPTFENEGVVGRFCRCGDLFGQPRLAHPGLASHTDRAALASLRGLHRGDDGREFRAPTGEGGRDAH